MRSRGGGLGVVWALYGTRSRIHSSQSLRYTTTQTRGIPDIETIEGEISQIQRFVDESSNKEKKKPFMVSAGTDLGGLDAIREIVLVL
mmetsp:Transcript_21732/g.33166  ORF Transcript_21732/g.33166 Transcript_21732/m.33166 type:complete len:88 (-) Transcript_21732:59-322(-)